MNEREREIAFASDESSPDWWAQMAEYYLPKKDSQRSEEVKVNFPIDDTVQNAITVPDNNLRRNEDVTKRHFDLKKNDLISKYLMVKKQQKFLAEQEKIFKPQILCYFHNSDYLEGEDGQMVMSYKPHMRSQFDTERFKKEHADLYQKYTISTEVRTLKIY